MSDWSRTIKVGPPGRVTRWAHRRCGAEPPWMCSPTPLPEALALLVPYRFRRWHHLFAVKGGYFWLPCPGCGREMGGHECGRQVYPPDSDVGSSLCPPCSRAYAEPHPTDRRTG